MKYHKSGNVKYEKIAKTNLSKVPDDAHNGREKAITTDIFISAKKSLLHYCSLSF